MREAHLVPRPGRSPSLLRGASAARCALFERAEYAPLGGTKDTDSRIKQGQQQERARDKTDGPSLVPHSSRAAAAPHTVRQAVRN